jgi:hypothetical protein
MARQLATYHQHRPQDPRLSLDGRPGSHGYPSWDHPQVPSFLPHGISYTATTTGYAANTPTTPSRKRKAHDQYVEVVDLTGDSPPNKASKRKRPAVNASCTPEPLANAYSRDGFASAAGPSSLSVKRVKSQAGKSIEQNSHVAKPVGKRRPEPHGKSAESHATGDTGQKPKRQAKQDGEKRLRRWRTRPPGAYREVRERALTQRMFALDRVRTNDNPEHPSETISLAGTTGNVYTIVVDKVPSCDCPHAKKGNQCKHIVYVLSRILRAPAELEYQLAFISSELRDIFANAPPLPSETASNDAQDGNRKPIEGECPICCDDFESESAESVVYCKAACGNNIHKGCFGQWAATKAGQTITCPFCRTPWQGDEPQLKKAARSGTRNAEGYVNVASQLGISGRRDYSTYNSYWVNREARMGGIAWDEDGVMDHEY